MSHQPMSMEALLDEERREVLALLGGQPDPSGPPTGRSSSAVASRSTSPYGSNPRSPIRSMLDLVDDGPGSPPGSRAASISGAIGGSPHRPVRSLLDVEGSPHAHPPSIRSMLDVDSASMPPISAQSSPTESQHRMQLPAAHKVSTEPPLHPRSKSDAATKPVEFGPRGLSTRHDPTAGYQFSDIITQNEGPVLSKRTQQNNSNNNNGNNNTSSVNANQLSRKAMAELMRGADISNLKLPGQNLPVRGRHSVSGASGAKAGKSSKSPSSRLSARSNSPNVAISGRGLSPAGRALLSETAGLDMQNAYRRLSDANLMRSGGSLSVLPLRKKSDDDGAHGSGRLVKDYMSPDGEHLESSEEENYSSDEDEARRGRKTARSFPGETNGSNSPAPADSAKGNRQPLSLLAAAEEERLQVSSTQPAYKYKSLLEEPEITVTNPSGERVKAGSKSGVTPNSSFEDRSRSASRTPFDSDDEAEIGDIKSAQKLAFSNTSIMSTPGVARSVQILYRGDFAAVQKQAVEEEHRAVRKYLVATDLSDESTHALEWTVGTVLRDGDTLVAIYCVDEELGIPQADGTQEDPKANPPATVETNPVKAEQERHRAVQDIAARIEKMLRRTRLQVRVIVEVLQCKTPRHIITEVIDNVNPTLVILGSRGRSALKGVILGSFSNYLVTKSSVPVMVARKRLRKHYKYRRQVVPQVNNLINPKARSLANAKID